MEDRVGKSEKSEDDKKRGEDDGGEAGGAGHACEGGLRDGDVGLGQLHRARRLSVAVLRLALVLSIVLLWQERVVWNKQKI